jgi:hypothetical protein
MELDEAGTCMMLFEGLEMVVSIVYKTVAYRRWYDLKGIATILDQESRISNFSI